MNKLIQGQSYRIKNSETRKDICSEPCIYVIPQKIKISTTEVGDLETFFVDCEGPSELIWRLVLPQRSIKEVTDDTVFSMMTYTLQREMHFSLGFTYNKDLTLWLREAEKIRGRR